MIDRSAVILLCSQAWGKTPDELEEKITKGKISMQTLMRAAKIQALSQSFASDELLNMIFPTRKAAIRKMQVDKDNAETYAALKARRDRGKK